MDASGEQPTILIIDDSPTTIRLLDAYLVSAGYRVHALLHPVGAIEAAARIRPDLILLDVIMPVVDGFTLCRELRAHEELRLVPIILITVLSDQEAKIQGLDAGADDFLSQPVDRVELLARVRSLIRLRRLLQARLESDRQRAELERELAVERVRSEEEARRRSFYRQVILAVTHARLNLVEHADLEGLAGDGEVVAEALVRRRGEMARIRDRIARAAAEAGMEDARVPDLVVCSGEAISNALRHGGDTRVEVRRLPDAIRVRIQDRGHGIDYDELPRATLMRGYSTEKPSLGYGFAVILELMDRVWLATGPGGTTVVLEMRLHPPTLDEELDEILGVDNRMAAAPCHPV